MGAYTWSRDKAGTGGKTHVAGAPVVLPPPPAQSGPPAKKARVWKREDGPPAASPGSNAPSQPRDSAAAAQQSGDRQHGGPAGPATDAHQQQAVQQAPRGTHAQQHSAPVVQGRSHPSTRRPAQEAAASRNQLAPASSQQQSLRSSSTAAAIAAQQEALRQQILQREAQLRQSSAASRAAEAAEKDQQKQERRKRLEAGFVKAFAEAKEAAAQEIAASKAPVNFADEQEVQRVLSCRTDYDVLRLQPGADGAAVRRRYREMAVTLHPDKCRAEQATDAFQRLVRAYQSLLKFAR